MLSLDDSDTEAPSNVNDADINEHVKVLEEQSATCITDSSLQRLLLSTIRLRLEVARRMNGIDSTLSEMSHGELMSLTTSITNSCRSCVSYILRTDTAEVVSFKRNFADLLLRRFILHLHRPLAGRSRKDPQHYFSRKMSIDAAMAVLSPSPKNVEFERLVLVGAGIFKNRMIHASLAVASEVLMDLDEHGPAELQSSSQEPSRYRRMLVEALREALQQSTERIRYGETNVKLHMKLSMVMRQTEAGEHASSKQQLAQSAKESLEASYAMIQRRAAPEAASLGGRGNRGTSEDFDPNDFSSENLFFFGSEFSLDDLFFLPTDLEMNAVS